jgi:uncharacterized protein with PIN domain
MGLKTPITLSLNEDTYNRFRKIASQSDFFVSDQINAWMEEYVRKYDEKYGPKQLTCPVCNAVYSSNLERCPQCPSIV